MNEQSNRQADDIQCEVGRFERFGGQILEVAQVESIVRRSTLIVSCWWRFVAVAVDCEVSDAL